MTPIQSTFIHAFKRMAFDAHETARSKGWWDERDKLQEIADAHSEQLGNFTASTLAASSVALIHSEASEALENIRAGCTPDDKIPEFTGEEAELADVVIRIFDHSEGRGLRVAEAIVAKMAMNATRSHKHGGKAI